MTITFRYKTVPRRNGTDALSPSIPLTLIGSKNSVDVVALLDTGADLTVMSRSVAELIGLNLSGVREKTFGIGESSDCVRTSMKVVINNSHEKYSFKIPVMVLMSNFDIDILIGRQVFFDKFKITFDQEHKKISLKRNNN